MTYDLNLFLKHNEVKFMKTEQKFIKQLNGLSSLYANRSVSLRLGFIAMMSGLILSLSTNPMHAQPSGGPYGPVPQKYDLPKGMGRIFYVAPNGEAKNAGDQIEHPTSIEAAFERVRTGDAIILRGGVYRTGNLILNQGITIQPYLNEEPVLKGTFVASDWRDLGNGLWITKWDRLFPMEPADWWRRIRFGQQTPLHRFNNDMVFVDGKFLQSVGWEGHVDQDSYCIDYTTGNIYIGVNPAEHLIEITAFDVAIHRVCRNVHGKVSDKKGPTIRGIAFTQYAYRAIEIDGTDPEGLSPESNHGKEVIGTTIEHCNISFCSRVAAYLRGDKMTIRHCKVSDTSTEGLYILSSSDVLVERNIFTKNNIELITGYYPAAVKIFNQCFRVTCNDNLVIDLPYSNGIWYDVGNVDGVFTNNRIENVGNIRRPFSKNQPWPSDNGFFFEISKGVVCAGNLFVNCDQGIFILNASDAKIYNNTLVNSMVCIARNARSAVGDHFGWHPSTGPEVDERYGHVFVNNLLFGDGSFKRPLLYVWQLATLCEKLSQPQLKVIDNNVYVQGYDRKHPLILWSPVSNAECHQLYGTLEEFRMDYPGFSSNSQHIANKNIPLFRSPDIGNFQLLPGFPGTQVATPLPVNIAKLMGLPAKYKSFVGAYPIQ